MRQAGILAAAGIYALDNNVELLKTSHQRTLCFAEQLNLISPLKIDISDVETNMLFIDFPKAANNEKSLATYLLDFDICIGDSATCRMVVHLDISREDIDLTLEKIFF